MSNWPYPRIVAHRGGGKLAPENTLAAIDVGAKYGHKMIEFDAKLSKDGEIFLLHDDNLERTSNGWGVTGMWSRCRALFALPSLSNGNCHASESAVYAVGLGNRAEEPIYH